MTESIARPRAAAGALAAVAALALPPSAIGNDSLTIVSWGGAYEASQKQAYYQPYTERTGTEIVQVSKSANGPAGIRSQVDSGNVTWDLVDVVEAAAIRLCDKGYVEPIDHGQLLKDGADGSPPPKDFIPTLHDCFIPEILFSTVLAYNRDMFDGDRPDSVDDVWNVDGFPGKRALEKIPAANLEWALMADGVDHARVYEVLRTPQGVSRAFESLGRIRDDVIWWTKGAQAPQLLADQEVSVASSYNGRIFNARVAEDQPFRIIWDGQVYEADGWVVPKGRLGEEVRAFVRFATDTQRLADQAQYISYGPARRSSATAVGRHAEHGVAMSPHMPTNPDNLETGIAKSARFWADRGDSLAERFNAWLAL